MNIFFYSQGKNAFVIPFAQRPVESTMLGSLRQRCLEHDMLQYGGWNWPCDSPLGGESDM